MCHKALYIESNECEEAENEGKQVPCPRGLVDGGWVQWPGMVFFMTENWSGDCYFSFFYSVQDCDLC